MVTGPVTTVVLSVEGSMRSATVVGPEANGYMLVQPSKVREES